MAFRFEKLEYFEAYSSNKMKFAKKSPYFGKFWTAAFKFEKSRHFELTLIFGKFWMAEKLRCFEFDAYKKREFGI